MEVDFLEYREKYVYQAIQLELDLVKSGVVTYNPQQVCDLVESQLANRLIERVNDEISQLAANAKKEISISTNQIVSLGGGHYQPKVSIQNGHLTLTVSNIQKAKQSFVRKKSVAIEGYGRVVKVSIKLDEIFTDWIEHLLAISSKVIEANYDWLLSRLNSSLNDIQDSLADKLYFQTYQVISKDLANRVWFYVVVDGYGFYLTSNNSRLSALENIKKSDLDVNQSPIELLTTFNSKLLPYDILLTKIAVSENKSLVSSLSGLKYSKSGVPTSEKAIYMEDELAVIPLVNEDNLKMTVGVIPQLKRYVEGPLSEQRNSYLKILNKSAKSLRSVVKELKSQDTLPKLKEDITMLEKGLDYFELKPNFFGFGINLNKVISDIKEYIKRKTTNNQT